MWSVHYRRLVGAFGAAALLTFMLARAGVAAECNMTASRIFTDASSSVARVSVFSIDPFDPVNKISYGVGTGFLMDSEGTMVTNYHVLLNAQQIRVTFGDGRSFDAGFIAGDPILDVAIIKVDASPGNFRALPFSPSVSPEIGTEVFAVGHPLGLKISISGGKVSSVDVVIPVSTMSWDEPYIQTDAAINPGNSGGPLINRCGQVIGMNTLGTPQADNIGFAIPMRIVSAAVAELLAKGKIARPWIGISGGITDQFVLDWARMPLASGFLVETIEPGSAAELAGLKGGYLPVKLGSNSYILGGDIITKVNDVEVTDLETTVRIVRSLKIGDKIKVEYFREGSIYTLEVVLPERPILAEDIRVLSHLSDRHNSQH